MAAVLTPGQYDLWLSLRFQHERRGFQGRNGPYDPGFECDFAPTDGS